MIAKLLVNCVDQFSVRSLQAKADAGHFGVSILLD